jgi:hypothetical protein
VSRNYVFEFPGVDDGVVAAPEVFYQGAVLVGHPPLPAQRVVAIDLRDVAAAKTTRINTRIHTHVRTRTPKRTHAPPTVCVHARTHTYAHTHTHTRKHAQAREGSGYAQPHRSSTKKSVRGPVWLRHCSVEFIKHVLPKLRRPTAPLAGGVPCRSLFQLLSYLVALRKSVRSYVDCQGWMRTQEAKRETQTRVGALWELAPGTARAL